MQVLLATDGSEQARAAAEWLASFPLPQSTVVRVLAVTSHPHGLLVEPDSTDQERQRRSEQASRIASEAKATLARPGVNVETRVTAGDARDEIVRMADEWPAHLVVLGARGLRPLQRALLGSVSTAVVRHAHAPVLVVRGRPRGLRTIVLAVDGSPDSLSAAAFLGTLPVGAGLRLATVAVIVPPDVMPMPELASASLFLDEALVQWRAEADSALDRAAAALDVGAGTIERRVVVGQPGEQIVSTANAVGADLIALGARGHGAFKRLLLGSVSEYVLHHADCPVLIVRGQGES